MEKMHHPGSGRLSLRARGIEKHIHRLQWVLCREQRRAHRLNKPFSAVIFDFPQSILASKVRPRDLLGGRIRASDEMVLVGAGHLCCILPETDRAGADVFSDRIIRILKDAGWKVRHTVYVYLPELAGDERAEPFQIQIKSIEHDKNPQTGLMARIRAIGSKLSSIRGRRLRSDAPAA